MAHKLASILILLVLTVDVSADWGVVGAGNATCKHWNSANKNTKTEILSWMLGFSSAVSIDFAADNQPQLRLKLLTYEYLTNEVNRICSDTEIHDENMSSILIGLLNGFPRVGSK